MTDKVWLQSTEPAKGHAEKNFIACARDAILWERIASHYHEIAIASRGNEMLSRSHEMLPRAS